MSAALAVSLAGLAGCVQLNENFIVQFSVTRRTDNQTHRSTSTTQYTVQHSTQYTATSTTTTSHTSSLLLLPATAAATT